MRDLANGEFDYFVSRRGRAAAVAQEVAEIVKGAGYTVVVQDYDIPYSADFIAEMHRALMSCRHLIVLLTRDYTASEFTMMEVTNFLAAANRAVAERRLIVLRLDDCELEGILASRVYADLVGITDPGERKARILAAVEGRSTAQPRRQRLFENVPPRDAIFMGRDEHLSEIHRLLDNADDQAATTHVAVHGLGGAGKSALVAEYAHRYVSEYSGVWWAPAEQRASLISSLAALAARLDPRLINISEQEMAAKAGLARLSGFTTPLLLVYDNVETPETVRDLLPSLGARILITTQWTDWTGRAAEMKLDVLSEDAAAQFLQARAARTDQAGAIRLAGALGCLPLALDHAGAYCRLAGPGMSFDDYRKKVDARITRPPRGYPRSVARTFDMAIEKAATETDRAETLLGAFAFLAPENIPLDLVTGTLLGEEERSDALMALAAVSLIEHRILDDGTPAVTVHRMVQAAMRAQLAAHGKTAGVLTETARCLTAAIPEGAYDQPLHWPRCTQLLTHVLEFRIHAEAADLRDQNLAVLCDRMGEFLYARASLGLAKTFFRQAVQVGQAAFGPRDMAVAKAENNLALVLHALEPKYDVESLLRDALAIELEREGILHASYARTLTSLANVLQDWGRLDEAEELLRKAIALGEETLGRRHPDVAIRLNNLATLLQMKGQIEEAEKLFRESIAAAEGSLGRGHPQVVFRLNNLALLLAQNGSRDEAEKLYREAALNAEQSLGPEHPHLATCLHNLANLLRDTGRASDAEALYLRSLVILTRSFGSEHVSTARAQTNYAKLLYAADRIGEARDLAQAAFGVHAAALGSAHRWTREGAELVRACREAPQPSASDDALLARQPAVRPPA